jgi:hypothetical protein
MCSNYTDIMIDIETTDTKPTSGILSIAVVAFNVNDSTIESKSLELLILSSEIEKYELTKSKSTMDWWMKQKEEVRNRAFVEGDRKELPEALTLLNKFCKENKPVRYWSQGINFDFVILENAMDKCNIVPNWKFYELRDSRTVQNLLQRIPIDKPKNAHNAVEDCLYQIRVLHYVYNKLFTKDIKNTNGNTVIKSNRDLSNWLCACGCSNFYYRNVCYICKASKDE